MKIEGHNTKCFCPNCINYFEDEEIVKYNGTDDVEEDSFYCPECYGEIVFIDEGITEIIKLLNESGLVKTVFCCEGHFDITEDGNDYYESLPYVSMALTEYGSFDDIFSNAYLPTDDIVTKNVRKSPFYVINKKTGETIGSPVSIEFMMAYPDYFDDEDLETEKMYFEKAKQEYLKAMTKFAIFMKMKGSSVVSKKKYDDEKE